MTNPTMKQLTNEDLLNELDNAIEKGNKKRQETIKNELRKRDQKNNIALS